MFLSLGGSRRRAAQQQGINAQQQVLQSQQQQQQEFSNQPLVTQEDPLKALATGKYASLKSSFGGGYCYTSEQVSLTTTTTNSPNSHSVVSLVSSDTEAISRDCTLTRRSQALDLAKKLKTSLGSKFADSLRETIKEVVMKHDIHSNNAWPLEESSNIDGSSENPFVARPEHSKRLSWFSQENLSQSAIAELSWGAGSTRVLDQSLKASWTDCSSRRSRHAFPEAAAMGTCSSGNPNFRNTRVQYKKVEPDGLVDVSKGLGKDCASLLEFLNGSGSSQPSQRFFHTKPADSWQEKASTSYYGAPLLQSLDVVPSEKGKRSREPDAFSSVEFTSKRQLLDVDDDGVAQSVDSILAGGFEEYLSNLAATTRVPSCPLADLLEDLSQDSIVPIHLPQGTLID